MNEWVIIHDALYGFGVRNGDKVIWSRDADRLLQVNISSQEVDLNAIYEEITILLKEERERRKPIRNKIKKISLPRVNREYPLL